MRMSFCIPYLYLVNGCVYHLRVIFRPKSETPEWNCVALLSNILFLFSHTIKRRLESTDGSQNQMATMNVFLGHHCVYMTHFIAAKLWLCFD